MKFVIHTEDGLLFDPNNLDYYLVDEDGSPVDNELPDEVLNAVFVLRNYARSLE